MTVQYCFNNFLFLCVCACVSNKNHVKLTYINLPLKKELIFFFYFKNNSYKMNDIYSKLSSKHKKREREKNIIIF